MTVSVGWAMSEWVIYCRIILFYGIFFQLYVCVLWYSCAKSVESLKDSGEIPWSDQKYSRCISLLIKIKSLLWYSTRVQYENNTVECNLLRPKKVSHWATLYGTNKQSSFDSKEFIVRILLFDKCTGVLSLCLFLF